MDYCKIRARAILMVTMLSASLLAIAGESPSYPQIVKTCATECLKEYRLPGKKDMKGYWLKCKQKKIHAPYFTYADFNGDSQEDFAFILIKKKGPGYGLFALVSNNHLYTAHQIFTSTDSLYCFTGINIVRPGTYTTAAGKGYGSQIQGEPDSVKISNMAINWFQCEGGNAFYYWNEAEKIFIEVWISD